MAYNHLGELHKYARIAQAPGENTWGLSVWQAAELAVEAVAWLTKELEFPTLPEMGIPEEDIPMLARLAFDDAQTVGNPRDIDVKGYEKVYRSCFQGPQGRPALGQSSFVVATPVVRSRQRALRVATTNPLSRESQASAISRSPLPHLW